MLQITASLPRRQEFTNRAGPDARFRGHKSISPNILYSGSLASGRILPISFAGSHGMPLISDTSTAAV